MDDSERSYGYSEDIYHGGRGAEGHYGDQLLGGEDAGPYFYPDRPHRERSYEYGAEGGMGDVEEPSPEEAAVHVRGGAERRGGEEPDLVTGEPGVYDYGRSDSYGVESFTWDAEGPYRGRGPRGERRPDARIHEEVCERLEAHGEVDASDVEVKVEQREVTLTGTVPDRRTKRLVERVAESVRGVADVHNQLRLKAG